MQTISEFRQQADGAPEPPPELDPCLRALWLGRRGEWEASHDLVNDIDTSLGSWIHAWLHRVEGDLSNAGYWYRLAGRPQATSDLEAEWDELVGAALAASCS